MNEKTEKLREKIIDNYSRVGFEYDLEEAADQILQACKEAGLKWPIEIDLTQGRWVFEEISL